MFRIFIFIFLTSLIYGEVPLDKPFVVESNSSNFDTDTLYTHKRLLNCSPQLDAVYKIEGVHRLKIIPRKPLQSGMEYRCKYKDKSINFKTEPLTLLNHKYFKRGKILKVEFNDKVNPEILKKHLKLIKRDKLSTTELKYKIVDGTRNALLIKIKELIYNMPVEVIIDDKLLKGGFKTIINGKPPASPATLDDKKEQMKIYDTPIMVAKDNGEFAIRLFLQDDIMNKIDNFVKVDEVENISSSYGRYLWSDDHEKFDISENSDYYIDIKSPEFKPHQTYHITLKKGLEDYSNRELKEDKSYTLRSGDKAKTIILDNTDKSYISNSGEFGFSSVNLDRVTLIVERILDDNMRYFVNFDEGYKDRLDRYSEEVLNKELILNNIRNQEVKQKFLLKELGKELPYGVYKLTFRYTYNGEEKSKSKVIFLSNIGISANISKTQAFIHTMKLDSAKPLISAMVYLYGKNNQLIGSAKSDKYGIVIIEDEKLLEKEPISIFVETKYDRGFLILNNPISSPSPSEILKQKTRFSANIYFQSRIVRPASKLNALITIKNKDFISADKIPVKVVFQEQYGKVLEEKIYHTDSYGLINFNYQLDSSDKSGVYELKAYIGDNIIGSTSIRVEAFMPPKIETQLRVKRDNYFIGELIDVNISSNYLFGTPASWLAGEITLNALPSDFHLGSYKGYSFTNELMKAKSTANIAYSENIRLDAHGKLNVVVPIERQNFVPSILKGVLGVTIYDDGQPVSTYKKVNIFPYRAMVGIKLSSDHFEKGKKLKGRVVLINPINGEEIKRKLYGTVKKLEWHYSYSDGVSNWERETKVIESFSIDANSDFSRNIPENGNYIVEISDRLGGHSATSAFDVWWSDYTNISPRDNLQSLDIEFENRRYKSGDTVIATIKSPILEGQLLITVEDERVEGYILSEIEKGMAKIEVPLNFDIKHGVYLHATVYRASDTSSKLIPFRAMGYKYIRPDNLAHKISVKIEAPKVTKSKKLIRLNVITDKPSKILVSVVDKGILQIVGQKPPRVFEFFDTKSKKLISYYDLYDNLMEYLVEGKLIDFGSDEAFLNRKKHLPPDLAKRIKPFMVWSGIIDTHSTNTTIGIEIPEFNGKASIVAIAIGKDSIGVGAKDIVVKDDIMIKPSYPLYALKGDKFTIPIRLFNTTKQSKTVKLTSQTSKNMEFILKDNNLTIAPNSSKLLEATLSAKGIGKGDIKLQAELKDENITKSVELPIYTPYTISTKTFKGISNKRESFKVPKEYIGGRAYITISDNLIGALANDLKYLISYPYGCAEQTASKIMAIHYAKPFVKQTSLIQDGKNYIKEGIRRLQNMQNSYGEFTYWLGSEEVNPYASIYASQTLLELNRDGIHVDKKVIDKLLMGLKYIVMKNDRYMGKYTNFHRVYAGYILAENGELNDGMANMLYEKGFYNDFFLSKYYMSAILKIKGKFKEANELYDSVGFKLSSYLKSRYSNRSDNFESNIRDMLIHFIIKLNYFEKDVKDLATIQKSFGELTSTQERALALKAVSMYLDKPTSSKLNVTLNINGEDRNYTKPTSLYIDKIKGENITLTPHSSAMSYNIELVKNLSKPLKNSLSKQELSIKREFIDGVGRAINLNALKIGDKIYSKVTISNYGKINGVVLNERVPACLTIIKSEFEKFQDSGVEEKYQDIRDDRVLNFFNLPKREIYDRKRKRYVKKQNISTIYTPLLVTTEGECKLPAVIIEAMYDSEIGDYAKESEKIRIIGEK